MKKRIITLFLISALAVCLMPVTSSAASELPDLSDKGIYYTPDYRSGDCILSSAKCMMRRAAIARGSSKWDTITNTKLRKHATLFGRLFKNSFKYKNDGIKYKVVNQELTGDSDTRLKDITALIRNHPEGIIIWGRSAARTGPHAVLITDVKDGVIYAADSTHNSRGVSVGIEPWKKTTMKALTSCSDVWYLSSIKGGSAVPAASGESTLSAICVRQPEKIKKGKGFGISGSVQSNYTITDVTVSIISSSGAEVISKSAKPQSCIYSLKGLDSAVKFGTLAAGDYKYRIIASDTKRSSAVLHENAFTVTGKNKILTVTAASGSEVNSGSSGSISISSVRAPSVLAKGAKFTFMGKVKASSKIKKVKVQVLDAGGKTVQSASAKPGKKSYNIKKLDSKIKFGELEKGSYTFRVKARTGSKWQTLVSQNFTVR